MPTEVLSLRAYILRRRASATCQAPALLFVTAPACETRWSDKVFPSRTHVGRYVLVVHEASAWRSNTLLPAVHRLRALRQGPVGGVVSMARHQRSLAVGALWASSCSGMIRAIQLQRSTLAQT